MMKGRWMTRLNKILARRYVVVTRPVRQGRLKLALEEVLSMTVATPSSRSAASLAAGYLPAAVHGASCMIMLHN